MIPILYRVNYNKFITSKLVLLLFDYTWFIVVGWMLILNEAHIRLNGKQENQKLISGRLSILPLTVCLGLCVFC